MEADEAIEQLQKMRETLQVRVSYIKMLVEAGITVHDLGALGYYQRRVEALDFAILVIQSTPAPLLRQHTRQQQERTNAEETNPG